MKTQLTAEESAKLVELGVSRERASMCLLNLDYDSEVIPCEDVWEENGRFLANVNDEVINVDRKIVTKDSDFDHSYANDNPIFTLADILDILPKEIEDYHLSIESFKETHYVAYIRDNNDDFLIPHKDAIELIDALYSLLVWAINYNHVKLD